MNFRSSTLTAGLALVCLSAFAAEEEDSKPTIASAPLSPAEVDAAVKIDSLSIPTPGELLAALNKLGKLDWGAKIRPPVLLNMPSRAQMALNLGGLVADGYIAVEAENSQQVKNIGKDILTLGKSLGVSKEILDRGKSLTEFAEGKQWDVLKEELEATQNEVKSALERNKDFDLINLVTLGGWVRSVEVLSGWIGEHYSEPGAKLLRQPGIAALLEKGLADLPAKTREENIVKKTQAKLTDIKAAVSFPAGTTPTVEQIKALNKLATDLMNDLSKKDK